MHHDFKMIISDGTKSTNQKQYSSVKDLCFLEFEAKKFVPGPWVILEIEGSVRKR